MEENKENDPQEGNDKSDYEQHTKMFRKGEKSKLAEEEDSRTKEYKVTAEDVPKGNRGDSRIGHKNQKIVIITRRLTAT